MTTSLEGIHTALVTPFDENERIDEEALSRLVDDQIRHGVHGFVVNGSTGEFPAMTAEERRRTVDVATQAAGGRVTVTVQVGAMTTREAVAHAEHAGTCGASAVMLVCPYYEPLSEQEIIGYVRAVSAVGVPVMIYNNPAATGWSMRPELIAQLTEIDGIRYLKDTTGDARRLFRIRELIGDRIEMLNGQDTLALLGFLAGTRGTVWGAPNATPTACVRLWELTVKELNLPAAQALWSVFYPVNRFFEDEGYVAAVKAGASVRGLNVGKPRRPILPLAPDRIAELKRMMQKLDEVVGAPTRIAAAV